MEFMFDQEIAITNSDELAEFKRRLKALVSSGKVKLSKGMGDSSTPPDLALGAKFNLTIPQTGFTYRISSQWGSVRVKVRNCAYPTSEGSPAVGNFAFNYPESLIDTLALGMTIPLVTGQLTTERGQKRNFITLDNSQGDVPSLSSLIGGQSPDQEVAALTTDEKAVYDGMRAKGKTHSEAMKMAKA